MKSSKASSCSLTVQCAFASESMHLPLASALPVGDLLHCAKARRGANTGASSGAGGSIELGIATVPKRWCAPHLGCAPPPERIPERLRNVFGRLLEGFVLTRGFQTFAGFLSIELESTAAARRTSARVARWRCMMALKQE